LQFKPSLRVVQVSIVTGDGVGRQQGVAGYLYHPAIFRAVFAVLPVPGSIRVVHFAGIGEWGNIMDDYGLFPGNGRRGNRQWRTQQVNQKKGEGTV
jgi:hypothetical protein